MLCIEAIEQLGFNCRTLNSGAIEVLTPLQHCDGEPVFAYISNETPVTISDNGDLLFFLIKNGIDIASRARHFANRAKKFGVSMETSGEFKIHTDKSIANSFGQFLEFASNFLTHELEAIEAENDEETVIDEVIALLQRRNGNLKIERSPTITGNSNQEHTFDILAGSTLIDVINPSSRATGTALRKATDIIKTATTLTPMFVIDDRKDHDNAQQEASIISSIAKIITYTDLEHGTSPLTTLQ